MRSLNPPLLLLNERHRLPMPEGLAPSVIESFDSHLQRIIDTYTLSGRSVLVHCRGGIGRAGLVACCWMIKLGLCGWIDTHPLPRSNSEISQVSPTVPGAPYSTPHITRDTLQLLELVISLIRSRRSLKAIETFEQVRFLGEYVEYLRAGGDRGEIQMGSVLQGDIRSA